MTSKVRSVDLIYLKTYIPTEVGEYSSYFINYLLEGSFTFRIAEAQNVSESHPEIGREIFFQGPYAAAVCFHSSEKQVHQVQGEVQMVCGLPAQAKGTFSIASLYGFALQTQVTIIFILAVVREE